MKVTLKLTRVGMTMEEATITRWCVQSGERFANDDVLYEIETEKVVQEVTAPAAGTMLGGRRGHRRRQRLRDRRRDAIIALAHTGLTTPDIGRLLAEHSAPASWS